MSKHRPPVDGSVLVPHWIHYHARHNPNFTLFSYEDEDADATQKEISYYEAALAFGRAARLTASIANPEQEGQAPEVIGVLAVSDSITYYTLFMGIFMAGCTPFLISPRNSPAAVAHLLKKTGTRKLFVSSDEQMQKLTSTAQAIVLEDGHSVELLIMPTFRELYTESPQDVHINSLPTYPQRDLDSAGFILHSSGSTAFPKPIILTHRITIQLARVGVFARVDRQELRIAAHALPPFHAMAIYPFMQLLYYGESFACFPPRSPPVVPSPANVLQAAVRSQCQALFIVPIFLEVWSRSPGDVDKLKELEAACFSGGPLNKAVGDELASKGVKLCSIYAGTEIGPGGQFHAGEESFVDGWHWNAAIQDGRALFVPQEDPNTFEVVYVETPTFTPAVFNSEVNGRRAFSTNDLVTLHPKNPFWFKIYGRKDDQLMLSTGEKTNPGPLETIICKHPLVHFAVIFGRGRAQNGILIQPVKGREVDPTDQLALAKFRNAIWPSIEEANAYAPTHSRLFKEMIIAANPAKPFEMTAKLTPRRSAVIEAYMDEIEAAYAAVEESAQTGVPPPSEWTAEPVQSFVRETVLAIVDTNVGDDDDIFVHGADSLKATYIRNSLAHALREAHKEPPFGIPQSLVYSNPSITLLTRQLLAFANHDAASGEDSTLVKLEEVDEMIAEFTINFPQHKARTTVKPQISGEVVLVTGTTGAFGVEILAHLTSSPDVSHVYAFNRPGRAGDKSLKMRQTESLAERGLDVGIVDSPKVTLVEGDTSLKNLGLEAGLYETIRDTITLIIINAWRVNFNLALGSFKPLVYGVRNLVDLALHSPRQSPPRLIFSSSVSVFGNWKGPGRPPEAPIDDPRLAMNQGYGASKFVAERILERASRETALEPVIVRIGQMTGNAEGVWNSGDWVPAIARSGQVSGVLPARDVVIDWIPIHTAAKVYFEFRKSKYQHLHLMHPNPIHWKTVFDEFSSLLKVPLVPWNDWLLRLENYKGDLQQNPAVHLVDFFRRESTAEGVETSRALLPYVTKALESSSTFADRSLSQLCREDVEKWVAYWKKVGLLDK